jgi:putative ABC transport system permease protein
VSIEESLRGLSGLDVGGQISFDVQGRKLTARVTSIRHVDWRNSRTGFMILFRPEPLKRASDAGRALNGPAGEWSAAFQRALVDKFPNVS